MFSSLSRLKNGFDLSRNIAKDIEFIENICNFNEFY